MEGPRGISDMYRKRNLAPPWGIDVLCRSTEDHSSYRDTEAPVTRFVFRVLTIKS